MAKVVINLATGLEDAERVTVAFLVGGAARQLDESQLSSNAKMGGATPLWEWIGDEPATVFSY